MNISPTIIHEDDAVLVIDKPAGVIVNRATSVKESTIMDWLFDRYPQLTQQQADPDQMKQLHAAKDWDTFNYHNFHYRAGIVHRLDKDTSGVLIIAKTPEKYLQLLDEFKHRRVQKSYLALTHGHIKQQAGVIDAPVGRLPWNRERFGVLAGGREALTQYTVLENFSTSKKHYPDPHFTLVECQPKTGRTHQLRIHLQHLGHPIVADKFYAGRKTYKKDLRWCPRLFLHASSLSIQNQTFHTSLPSDLQTVLDTLS